MKLYSLELTPSQEVNNLLIAVLVVNGFKSSMILIMIGQARMLVY